MASIQVMIVLIVGMLGQSVTKKELHAPILNNALTRETLLSPG